MAYILSLESNNRYTHIPMSAKKEKARRLLDRFYGWFRVLSDQSKLELKATPELLAGDIYVQKIVPEKDWLSGISIQIGIHRRMNSSKLVFRLLQKEKGQLLTQIAECDINTGILFDNDFYEFNFSPIKYSSKKEYLLTIFSPDAVSGNAISLWKTVYRPRERVLRAIKGYFGISGGEIKGLSLASRDRISSGTTPKNTYSENLSCQLLFSPPYSEHKTPPHITFSPVTQCNLNCIHCISADTRKRVKQMPGFIKDKLKQLSESGQIKIMQSDYSGDIIFADQKYGGLLDYLISLNVPYAIDTNGNVMNTEVANKLLSSKMRRLNFSLDAGTAETYAAIRKGSIPLDDVFKNIDLFVQEKAKRIDHPLQVMVSMTLMKCNIREVCALIDRAKSVGVYLIGTVHTGIYDKKLRDESLYLHQELYNEYYDIIKSHAQKEGVHVHLPQKFENTLPREGHRYCKEPWRSAVLLGNGDVMACCVPGTLMGNLHETSLEEIWSSEKYQDFRLKVNSDNPPGPCNKCPMYRYENNPNSYLFCDGEE